MTVDLAEAKSDKSRLATRIKMYRILERRMEKMHKALETIAAMPAAAPEPLDEKAQAAFWRFHAQTMAKTAKLALR